MTPTIEYTRLRCPRCGTQQVRRTGTFERVFCPRCWLRCEVVGTFTITDLRADQPAAEAPR